MAAIWSRPQFANYGIISRISSQTSTAASLKCGDGYLISYCLAIWLHCFICVNNSIWFEPIWCCKRNIHLLILSKVPNVTNGLNTVYPKKYAHGFCFAVLCCGYTLTDFPISIRLTSLALWQSNDCPSASKATLMNMNKYFIWIHYERLHNHNKAKHNKTVCIFLRIYCSCDNVFSMEMPWYSTGNETPSQHISALFVDGKSRGVSIE